MKWITGQRPMPCNREIQLADCVLNQLCYKLNQFFWAGARLPHPLYLEVFLLVRAPRPEAVRHAVQVARLRAV
jgi:hypothetical protein